MKLHFEEEIREATVIEAAGKITTAARTAPESKPQDSNGSPAEQVGSLFLEGSHDTFDLASPPGPLTTIVGDEDQDHEPIT